MVGTKATFLSHRTQEAISDITYLLRAPVYAKLLLIGFNSGLFSYLKRAPKKLTDICRIFGWHATPTEDVLNSMVYSGYLKKSGEGFFTCSPKIAILVHEYKYVQDIIKDWDMVFEDLRFLPDVLISGRLNASRLFKKWTYKGKKLNYPKMPIYSEEMERSSEIHSALFLDAVDLSKYGSVLDVGGGYGEFARQVCKRYPDLRVGIFDLPYVVKKARLRMANYNLRNRVKLFSGNVLKGDLPTFGQAITLNRILWDWRDKQAIHILHKAYNALPSGGRIFVYEGMYSGNPYLDRLRAATAIQCMFFGGKTRSTQDIISLLREVGFDKMQILSTKLPAYKIITGRR